MLNFGARVQINPNAHGVGTRQIALLEQAVEARKDEIAGRAPGVAIYVDGKCNGDFADFSFQPDWPLGEDPWWNQIQREEKDPFDLNPFRLVKTAEDAEGIASLTSDPDAFLSHALNEAERYATKYNITPEPPKVKGKKAKKK